MLSSMPENVSEVRPFRNLAQLRVVVQFDGHPEQALLAQ
jgi:hypothetical protein